MNEHEHRSTLAEVIVKAIAIMAAALILGAIIRLINWCIRTAFPKDPANVGYFWLTTLYATVACFMVSFWWHISFNTGFSLWVSIPMFIIGLGYFIGKGATDWAELMADWKRSVHGDEKLARPIYCKRGVHGEGRDEKRARPIYYDWPV
jgi:hypothetical protein